MNNLYIVNEVLHDYTAGMVVICAPSKEQSREIFSREFEHPVEIRAYDSSIERGLYTEIKGVNHPAGVVSYVWGGG